jgi:hypothetical protein
MSLNKPLEINIHKEEGICETFKINLNNKPSMCPDLCYYLEIVFASTQNKCTICAGPHTSLLCPTYRCPACDKYGHAEVICEFNIEDNDSDENSE